MSRKIEITIVPRELGQLVDEIIEDILNHMHPKVIHHKDKTLLDLIPYHYYPTYNLYQGKCYQQYTSNACGYHATFNTLCFLNYFAKHQDTPYNILSRGSFWRFKVKVQNFLSKYKKVNKLKEEWPWKQNDIRFGDFQRTYNQVCTKYLDDFQIFRNHPNFQYLSGIWEFQYKNLIWSASTKKQLQEKIQYFKDYNGNKPLVFNLMLAITTHWTCFIALKYKQQIQFWFFDSFNNLTLDYTPQQIVEFINQKNQERKKDNRPQMTQFQKQTYAMCQLDTQISLKLIIECLTGKNTLDSYIYNQQFNIFADHIESALSEGGHSLQNVLRDYRHNIRSFYNSTVQWNYLNQKNCERMNLFIELSSQIRDMHEEGKQFYNYLKKYIK